MARPAVLRAAGAVLLAVVAAGTSSASTAQPPRVLGVVGHGKNARLEALDPRTLAPLSSPRPLRICSDSAVPDAAGVIGHPARDLWALSADRSRAVFICLPDGPGGGLHDQLLVVDVGRFRIVKRWTLETSEPWGIAWVGADAFVLFGVDAGSGVCCDSYDFVIDGELSGGATVADDVPLVAPNRVLIWSPPNGLDDNAISRAAGPGDDGIDISRVPPGQAAAALDAAHNRLFIVSAAGVAAEVRLVRPEQTVIDHSTVSYHALTLPSRFDSAAWVGQGRIALWGADGLTLIDTRDWTAHTIDASASEVTVSTAGILAWSRDHPSVTVYDGDGSRRFQRLLRTSSGDLALQSVQASGPYAYLNTTNGRFSLDLTTGILGGPLASRARLLLPDYLYLH
jgi:hypothetical protein